MYPTSANAFATPDIKKLSAALPMCVYVCVLVFVYVCVWLCASMH